MAAKGGTVRRAVVSMRLIEASETTRQRRIFPIRGQEPLPRIKPRAYNSMSPFGVLIFAATRGSAAGMTSKFSPRTASLRCVSFGCGW